MSCTPVIGLAPSTKGLVNITITRLKGAFCSHPGVQIPDDTANCRICVHNQFKFYIYQISNGKLNFVHRQAV